MRGFVRPVLRAMCVIMTLAGCSAPAKQAADPAASARPIEQVAWDVIAGGAPVIDVRTDSEFQQGHLPGAINIPYDQITSRLAELPADRKQPIVLYCRSGRRSGIAQRALEELGFTSAINAGGYESLMRARPR